MRWSISSLGIFALLSSIAASLTVTSPIQGSRIDPTRPIEIKWESNSSDPSTIDFWYDHKDPTALTVEVKVGGADTSSGSYTIPANTIQDWGTGYVIQVLERDGEHVLAEVTDLTLSPFSNSVSTASNGQLTLVSSTTTAQEPITASASLQSATTFTTLSGTATPEPTTTSNVRSSGFITSSISRSSSEASVAATSASITNTANGQIQMRGSELALGAAGVLAGIVALLA